MVNPVLPPVSVGNARWLTNPFTDDSETNYERTVFPEDGKGLRMGVGGHRDTSLRGVPRVTGATNWRSKSIFHGLHHAPKISTGVPGRGVFLRPVPLLCTGIPDRNSRYDHRYRTDNCQNG